MTWNLLERVPLDASCFQVSFRVAVLYRWRWLGPPVQLFFSFSIGRQEDDGLKPRLLLA
ncbi:hypothetical protein DPMN_167276 [Dreissena polymorpha]|uniref:Uncharacterized protein n=1 Tax=Dreissena polymorpha TaxID=45954 RepID=A0A9D4F465_DREPO|nr:hypothetical protein DPMN_167276 [Dreissena polymorpha]